MSPAMRAMVSISGPETLTALAPFTPDAASCTLSEIACA
jgi:hypothetical protein